jgi:hypothetical protein
MCFFLSLVYGLGKSTAGCLMLDLGRATAEGALTQRGGYSRIPPN